VATSGTRLASACADTDSRVPSLSAWAAATDDWADAVMAMARGKAEADTAVSPGETTLAASLDVVFELGQ
jgi:uncharacterized protein YggE